MSEFEIIFKIDFMLKLMKIKDIFKVVKAIFFGSLVGLTLAVLFGEVNFHIWYLMLPMTFRFIRKMLQLLSVLVAIELSNIATLKAFSNLERIGYRIYFNWALEVFAANARVEREKIENDLFY